MVISLNNRVSAKFLWECSRTKGLFALGFLPCQGIHISPIFHPFKRGSCRSREMRTRSSVVFPGWVIITWWVTAMGTQGLVFLCHQELARGGVPKLDIDLDFSLDFRKIQLHQLPWKDGAWWLVPAEGWWVRRGHIYWKDGKPGSEPPSSQKDTSPPGY